jgi:hypothetical protein
VELAPADRGRENEVEGGGKGAGSSGGGAACLYPCASQSDQVSSRSRDRPRSVRPADELLLCGDYESRQGMQVDIERGRKREEKEYHVTWTAWLCAEKV